MSASPEKLTIFAFTPYPCCAVCGYLMRGDPDRERAQRSVIIECANPRCGNYEKRMRLDAQIVECEVVDGRDG